MGKIRTAIITGTGVPLLMFLAWDAAILGSLKPGVGAGGDPLQSLIGTDPVVGTLVQVFSFLAVATSFIGFVFGLVDFVGDLLNVSSWSCFGLLTPHASSWEPERRRSSTGKWDFASLQY